MLAEFLLEIGTEEIPALYLEHASNEFKRILGNKLMENNISILGDIQAYYTPRRIVLFSGSIEKKQKDMTREITGPPKKAAYDGDGNPTKAAIGFAKKNSVAVEDLQSIETPKGEYLFLRLDVPGRPTNEILSEILPGIIGEIPWPKSMRWGDVGFSFARPIHWILTIFDGEIVPFNVAGVSSSNRSMGHRFMSSSVIEVKDFKDYLEKMKTSHVMIDQDERSREIEREVKRQTEMISGVPIEDPELITINANLVEYPSAVCGSFDRAFLDLPAPVLITAMREHQKYFAIQDKNSRLMPNFIAINNTITKDESAVRKGHERVLRARLSDAVFFFKEDRKKSLEDRLEDLKGVIYQAELGTSFAKVERFTRLASYLSEKLMPEKGEEISLTARLCKCDLITEMVMEFPTLQGVMGMEYARLAGHPEEVCQAIREHYFPIKSGDMLPTSSIGAIVGLADRMDSIAGCFAIGQEPTGAADPFALRRHALSIIRILEERNWALSLSEFIRESLNILKDNIKFDPDQVFDRMRLFFKERYKNKMLGTGYETDLIEAVLSASFNRIDELPLRIKHLHRFMTEFEDFESVALTFKRVSNILKNQEQVFDVDENLFKDRCEEVLWKKYKALKDRINSLTEKKEYFEALNLIAGLKIPVDDFFDGVEVLTKESPDLRNNRLAVLYNLAHLFMSLVDFSKFSI